MNKTQLFDAKKFKIIAEKGSVVPHAKSLADVPRCYIVPLSEAAKIIHYSATGLRRYKDRPGMPPYYKKGFTLRGTHGTVFYDKRDLKRWLAKFKVIIPA